MSPPFQTSPYGLNVSKGRIIYKLLPPREHDVLMQTHGPSAIDCTCIREPYVSMVYAAHVAAQAETAAELRSLKSRLAAAEEDRDRYKNAYCDSGFEIHGLAGKLAALQACTRDALAFIKSDHPGGSVCEEGCSGCLVIRELERVLRGGQDLEGRREQGETK